MALDKEEVLQRFEPRQMDAEQLAAVAQVREGFQKLAGLVLAAVPPGREQSMTLTHLEEASFIAVAGVARRNG